jgi:outer membrane protein assembly factor BamB
MPNAKNLVFVSLNGRVAALDQNSGTIQWEWKASKSGSYMTMLADKDRLVVSAGGYIYCLNPVTGEELWNNPLKGYRTGVTALATMPGKNLVFVSLNWRVAALDRGSGTIQWEWKSPKSGSYMTMLAEKDRLIVSAGGYIYCLHPATGEELWNNPLKGYRTGVTAMATMQQRTSDAEIAGAAATDAASAAAAGAGATAAGS